MKKFISVLILSLSSQVFAVDWSVVKGGAQGYLDSVNGVGLYGMVQVFWHSTAGEKLAITSFSIDPTTTTTKIRCSITNFDAPTVVITSGIVSEGNILYLSIPTTDLYLATCGKVEGASGSIIIGVFKEEFFKK